MANAVTIALAVTGASKVIDTMHQVGQGAESLRDRVDKARTAFLAVGGAVAGFAALALNSYESVERLRRTLVDTVGENSGNRLADQIRAVAEQAKSSGDMLRQFALNWVNMVQGGESSVIRMMQALDKLGGAMDEQGKARASFQLAQIGSMPKVQWEDLKELIQAGIPMVGVTRRLGVNSAREISGMDTSRFLEAFMAEAGSRQDRSPLPTTAIANTWERLVNLLAKTGEKVAGALDPLIRKANEYLNWFERWDKDGTKTFTALKVGLVATAVLMGRYALAVVRATFALERMALVGAAGAATGAGAAGVWMVAGKALGAAFLAALAGWEIGKAISSALDQWAKQNGYANAGEAAYENMPWNARRQRAANSDARNRRHTQGYGYTGEESEKIAGVVERMNAAAEARQAKKVRTLGSRANLQNMAATLNASAMRSY